jgi:carbamoyl-phosphate synthase large subunit
MKKIGLDTARSGIAHTMEEALAVAADVGYPCIIRPSPWAAPAAVSPTTAKSSKRFANAVWISPPNELLIDESLIGWKEYEMEVVRDKTTTASSSAPSKTSTPWASTPVTPSPLRRRRP